MKIIEQYWQFEQKPENALEILERAARTCYKSEDKIADGSAEKLIRNIIKRGHESVLEHVSISIRIITSRACSHELVRHRLASYSQTSQRYVKYNNHVTFILPVGLELGTVGFYEWKLACYSAENAYNVLLNIGHPPQTAREVLPNSTETEIFMTANVREWRHIFKLRTSKAALPQMRYLMTDIMDGFIQEWPILFGDLKND